MGKFLKTVFLVLQDFASPVNSPAALHLSLNFPSLQSVPPRWRSFASGRFTPRDAVIVPKHTGIKAGTSRGKKPSGAASEPARNTKGGAQSKLGITRQTHPAKARADGLAFGLGFGVAIAAGVFPAIALGQQNAKDMKARIMQLLTQLHDPDSQAAAQAKTELKQLGLREEDIQVGWQLKHPDPAVRRELAQTLGRAASPQHADLVLELTKDPNRQVRLAALEAVRTMPDQPNFKSGFGRSPVPTAIPSCGETPGCWPRK